MRSRARRLLRAPLVAGVAVAALALGMLSAGASRAAATTRLAEAGLTAGGHCMPGSTCITIEAACPSRRQCPTVTAEPTTELQIDQYIYLRLAHFPVDSTAEIYYCSDRAPLSVARPPSCQLAGQATFQYPYEVLPVSSSGAASTSFHVQLRPKTPGDPAFSGEIPGDDTAPHTAFFCDDGANPCSIDVVDPSLLPASTPPVQRAVPQPADTAVVPVRFASASHGCPGAAIVSTTSDFSIEALLPHEAPFACARAHPAVALNTATDTETAVAALASGSAAVGFVDDPQAPEVAKLVGSGDFALVPVAESAVVVGYSATMQAGFGQLMYPFHGFRLTPNQVAGLFVYDYQSPYNADVVRCPLPGRRKCSALEELNALPGFTPPGIYGSFPPSGGSGVTEAVTNWVCHAPNLPFAIEGKLVHDPHSAATTLTTSDYESPWPIRQCAAFDQLPALRSPAAGDFDPASDPAHQVKYLRAFAPPPGFSSAVAGFAPMDWGDARVNGLDVAALQNAAGQFVAPSARSVDAELAAESLGSDGALAATPDKAVKGGYPLATVIYALVPDHHVSTGEEAGINSLLNGLVAYTSDSSRLPDGYVGLSPRLASAARSDLVAVASAEAASSAPPSTTTPNPRSQSPGGASSGRASSGSGPASASGTKSGAVPGSKRPSSNRSHGTSQPSSLVSVTLASSGANLALPGALASGVVLALLAIVLLFAGKRRARHQEPESAGD